MSTRGCDYSSSNENSAMGSTTDQPSVALMNLPHNAWNKQFMNGNHHVANSKDGIHYSGGHQQATFLNDLVGEHAGLGNTINNSLEFLALQFPGFAAESLSDVYHANGCNLNLTLEILTQLEFQVNGDFNQNQKSKNLPSDSAPSLSADDFRALQIPEAQNGLSMYRGEDTEEASNVYHSVDKDSLPFLKSSSSGTFRCTPDFVSAVRKLAPQDAGHLKQGRNGSAFSSTISTGSSQNTGSSYNRHGKSLSVDRLLNTSTARAVAAWLETGVAVGNMYEDSREEACDFARLRNACFEQATEAYLIGNKALAKELSMKGRLYSIQMQAAHEKARESIYKQRNPVAPRVQGYSRGQDPLIDLHGLHVSEAIHMLKHELSILRRTASSAGQPLQVMICVGTGHHTKGSRTPARLLVAVGQYLLEEGLQYTEPQPGLLRVVIH